MANETFHILRVLIENQTEKFSIRQLSLLRKINYKSAYKAITALAKDGLVLMDKRGNHTLCSFSQKFSPLVFAVEFERRKELLKDKNFKVIYSRFSQLKFPFILLLFGSVAKKTAGRHSDIDFLAITENSKEVEREVSLIPLNIHLTAVSYKEFIMMAKSREFSVVSEAMKKNIILNGIEDYYQLVQNAG